MDRLNGMGGPDFLVARKAHPPHRLRIRERRAKPLLPGAFHRKRDLHTFQDFLLGLPGCAPTLTAAQCSASAAAGLTNGSATSNISSSGTSAAATEPGGEFSHFRAPVASAFVQDDFKVSKQSDAEPGLRWEYNGLIDDTAGQLTNVWPSLINTVNVPVTQGGTLGTSAATGSLAGFVVPSNYNPALNPPPTVGGIFQNNRKTPTQNAPPLTAFAPRLRPGLEASGHGPVCGARRRRIFLRQAGTLRFR